MWYMTSVCFSKQEMERILNHLKRVLEGMAENEQSRVMELPMMSEEELEEVIVEWNQTAANIREIGVCTSYSRSR